MKKLLSLLLITTYPLFALVSIVPVEIGANPGWSGQVGLSLETKRGNTHKDNYKAGFRLNYDNNISSVTWGEISGEYGESNEVKDTNKAYVHLRHIHAITDKDFCLELFAQTQEDEFKSIAHRRVAGGGGRYKFFQFFENDNLYFGAGAFYEAIKYSTDVDPYEENYRGNIYLAYTTPLREDSKLAYTFYYQPDLDDALDYVQSHKLDLQLHIYLELYLSFRVTYDIDSEPAVGVSRDDFSQMTSFIYKF